ncbi:MAG: hypothetical protein KatS3mg082_2855 [Nitrospiraceae bacterium]|nr:MAG: hypothetical protein KatS3mg082_2855 [Nitrospiraceae bacterium]
MGAKFSDIGILLGLAAVVLSEPPPRLEVASGLAAIDSLLEDQETVRVPIDEWRLEGFERDLSSEYRTDSVWRVGPGGRIVATVPVQGDFYPAVVFYDGPGDERFELRAGGRAIAFGVANEDNNRQKLYFSPVQVHFESGETLELRALTSQGSYRTESLLLLRRKPTPSRPAYAITHPAAQLRDDGKVSFTWITNWRATCTVEWEGSRIGKLMETSAENNHRLVADAPSGSFRYRIVAISPDGQPVTSVWQSFQPDKAQPVGTAKRERLQLEVGNPLLGEPRWGGNYPVTSGVPFPKGVLASDAELRLLDSAGREVPLQTRTLARWSDGSVKWALLDFQARGGSRYALEYGRQVRRRNFAQPLTVTESAAGVTVVTGPLKVFVSRERYSFPGEIWFDENGDFAFEDSERVSAGGRPGKLTVEDVDGNTFSSAAGPADVAIEESGPLRAVVRIRGAHHSGRLRLFGYTVRLHLYAGQPYLRVAHTFVNDSEAAEFTTIRSLELDWPLTGGGAGEPVRISQFYDDHYQLERFSGVTSGRRSDGIVSWTDGRRTVTLALRDFWQNYPKQIASGAAGFRLALCPRLEPNTYAGARGTVDEHRLYYFFRDGGYKLRQGVSKTHDIWLAITAGRQAAGPPLSPLRARAPAEWYAASKAFGELAPVRPSGILAEYDAAFAASFDAYLANREKNREYGMLNFGDWWGEREINWGNSEYDTQHAFLLQWARTGDWRYFRAAEEMEWHNRDIDTVHHHRDPTRVGGVYPHVVGHTGDYYRESPVPGKGIVASHFTISHTFIEGHLDYYFLTGDRRSFETAALIADRYDTLGTRNYDFTNCRNPGWHLILTIAMYNATGDPFYLNAARIIVDRVFERQTPDGGWRRQLVPEHCECLPRHHGNAGFMVGILMTGLRYYWEATNDERAARSIERAARFLVADLWTPEVDGFRYTSCPRTQSGAWSNFLLFDGIVFAHRRTGDPVLGAVLRHGTLSALKTMHGWGKDFTQYTRVAPHFVGYLAELLRQPE